MNNEDRHNEPADSASAEMNVVKALRSLDVAPVEVERYGIHPDQFIEWYGPSGGRTVVMMHGGYFHEDGTLSYLRPAAYALGEAGYRVALPEYRRELGNQAITFADAQTLSRLSALENAMWVGHSSGAVFALHVLFSDACPVKHAVVLSPIFDMARAAEEDEAADINPTAAWMQGLPSEIPDTYGKWEPLGLYSQIGASGFQQRGLRLDVIHGALDQTVPASRTQDLVGEPFNIAIVPGENHNDVIRPGSDSWLLLLGALG